MWLRCKSTHAHTHTHIYIYIYIYMESINTTTDVSNVMMKGSNISRKIQMHNIYTNQTTKQNWTKLYWIPLQAA